MCKSNGHGRFNEINRFGIKLIFMNCCRSGSEDQRLSLRLFLCTGESRFLLCPLWSLVTRLSQSPCKHNPASSHRSINGVGTNEVNERDKMDGERTPLVCSPVHSLVCITWITEHTLPLGLTQTLTNTHTQGHNHRQEDKQTSMHQHRHTFTYTVVHHGKQSIYTT